MKKRFTNKVVSDILGIRLPKTKEFQKVSYITPDGYYLEMTEHYEAIKFLVVEGLVNCNPDGEQLLSELGYLRYSWIGYLTLPEVPLTNKQYDTLEDALIHISALRDTLCVQIQNQPKFYLDMDLSDIPNIIKKIKRFYSVGELVP